MTNKILCRVGLVLMVLFTLPVFLHVYNPSMQLGGFGLFLGFVGMIVSPILILVALGYFVKKNW